MSRKTSFKSLVLGGLDYVFDGGTAVRYPTANLPTNWYERYTISGWIFGQVYDERQYIISWSDGDTVRHDNMGFYMGRYRNGFVSCILLITGYVLYQFLLFITYCLT